MVTQDALTEVKQAIGRAAWNMGFAEFVKRAHPEQRQNLGEAEQEYWLEKFTQFRNLSTALGRFDDDTLWRIINPE